MELVFVINSYPLKEVAQLDTDNWENIRGPRDTEDLTQYNKIKWLFFFLF